MANVCNESEVYEYMKDAFKFLAEFSWIYDEKNVDIFVGNVLEKIPEEWVNCLGNVSLDEMHQIPFDFCKDEWPESLKHFLRRASVLSKFRYRWRNTCNSILHVKHIEIPDFIVKSTPAKKLDEIRSMASLIGQLAAKHNCGTVIDVGSGLGYLDQVLHCNFGLVTVGFESVNERSVKAASRVRKGYCTKNMLHITCKVESTDECQKFIRQVMKDIAEAPNSCPCGIQSHLWDKNSRRNIMIIGLHSCGNLFQDMMRLFCQLPELTVFAAVGCCYHKILLEDFPVSGHAKSALTVTRMNTDWSPCTTGLRLGCQATRESWCTMSADDHVQQEKCLFYRSLFQYFLHKENLVWHKPKRHFRKNADMSCIKTFTDTAFQGFPWSDAEKEEYYKKFMELYKEKCHILHQIRIFNLLQVLLQPTWEAVIISDRLAYFHENSVTTTVFQMCEEHVSPRNLAVYGTKIL